MPNNAGVGRFPVGLPGSRRFWVVASLIYMSLIYSTAIHYAFGSERTINLTFFSWPRDNNPLLQERFPDKARWIDEPLKDVNAELVPVDFWKLTSLWGDAGYYVLQSGNIRDSIAPYKYRFLPTLVVGSIASLTGLPIPVVFAVFNCALTLATALVFTHFLLYNLRFSALPALIGGVLFVTMFANTQTIPLPMLEPASFLLAALIFKALHALNWRLFVTTSVLGVATKEILVATSFLWVINSLIVTRRRSGRWPRIVFPALVPVLVFVAIRLAFGGGALDVNYGYNVLRGALPVQYAARLLTPWGAADVALRLFLGFSFLWLGLRNVRKDPFLSRNIVFIPIVLIATVLLSSRITRIVGILFPLVLPAFLMFIEDPRTPAEEDAVRLAPREPAGQG